MNLRCAMLIVIGLLLLITTASALSGNWTEVNDAAAFSERYVHSSVVYNNKMWVIGGNDGDYRNDVWSSSDGITWTEVKHAAAFSPRQSHTSLVYDNKMWVIGGVSTGAVLKNDVWSSSDGVTWTEVKDVAAFSARNSHTSVVYDNKMWVIGGQDGALKNDVWSSSDGVTWTEVKDVAAFSARNSHTSVVYDDKMWVIAGQDAGENNDVWSSSDGVTWTEVKHEAAFSKRYVHSSVVYDNKMWVIGGLSGGSDANDAWYSSDGVTWSKPTVTNDMPFRRGHTSIVSESKMWIIGGVDNIGNKKDTWSFLSSPVAGFTASPRSGVTSLSVTFTDASTGYPSSYSWTFGDGSTSSSANPVNTYTAAGTYTVSQTVTNSDGTSTETKSQYISVTLPVPVTISNSGDNFPSPVTHPLMTIPVNVGGNSAVTRVTATGTGLSDLIVTGIVQQAPGTGIPLPPGTVYQYVDLVPARYITITGSEIRFSVPVSWLEEHHISRDNVIMYHYTGKEWEALPTTVLTTVDNRVFFLAQGSGFSLFAIGGNPDNNLIKPQTRPSPSPSIDLLPKPENTPVTTIPVVVQTTSPLPAQPVQPTSGSPLVTIILTAIGCIGLLAGGVLVRRWWIRRQNPALFRNYK